MILNVRGGTLSCHISSYDWQTVVGASGGKIGFYGVTPVAQPAGADQAAVTRGNTPGDWRPTIRSADPQAKDMALRHKARVGTVQGGA